MSAVRFVPFQEFTSLSGFDLIIDYKSLGASNDSFKIANDSSSAVMYDVKRQGKHTFGDGAGLTTAILNPTGLLSISGRYLVPSGSQTQPTYSFSQDQDTGIYHGVAADSLALTTAGTTRMTLDAAGNANFNGLLDLTAAGIVRGPPGTEAAPTYSFQDETNTGMYLDSAGTLAFTTLGTKKVTIDSDGDLEILAGNLNIAGNVNVTGVGTVISNLSTLGGLAIAKSTRVVGGATSTSFVFDAELDTGITGGIAGNGLRFKSLDIDTLVVSSTGQISAPTVEVTSTGLIKTTSGSNSLPSLTSQNHATVGIFSPGVSSVAVTTNGIRRWVLVNDLNLSGNMYLQNSAFITGIFSGQDNMTTAGGMGIQKNVFVGGFTEVSGTATTSATATFDTLTVGAVNTADIDTAGLVSITAEEEVALACSGTMTVVKALNVSGTTTLCSTTPTVISTDGTLFSVAGAADFTGGVGIAGTLNVSGTAEIGSATKSIFVNSAGNLTHKKNSIYHPISNLVANATAASIAAADYYGICYIDLETPLYTATFTLSLIAIKSGTVHVAKYYIAIRAGAVPDTSFTSLVHLISNKFNDATPLFQDIRISSSAAASPRVFIDVSTATTLVERIAVKITDYAGNPPTMGTLAVSTGGAEQQEFYDLTTTNFTSFADDLVVIDSNRNISFGTTTPCTVSCTGLVVVSNTTASTNSTNGCAVFAGGVGVANSLIVASSLNVGASAGLGATTRWSVGGTGNLIVNNTLDSTIASTGCAVFSGGIGVSGAISTSGSVTFNGPATLGPTTPPVLSTAGIFTVNNTADSVPSSSGCAVFSGGAGVAGAVNASGSLMVTGSTTLGSTTPITFGPTGSLVVSNTIASSHALTGCVILAGGIGLTGNIRGAGILTVDNSSSFGTGTPLLIAATGGLYVQNALGSSNASTGAALFSGGIGVVKEINVSGSMNVSGTADFGLTNAVSISGTGRVNVPNTSANAGVFKGGIAAAKEMSCSGVVTCTNSASFGSSNPATISTAGILDISNTFASSDSLTGCAVFNGGVSVAKTINCGGTVTVGASGIFGTSTPLNISSTGLTTVNNTIATSLNNSTGSARFLGGIGVAGKLCCSGFVNASGDWSFGTSDPVLISAAGIPTVQNTAQAVSSSNASAVFNGGLGVATGIACSGMLYVTQGTEIGDSTPFTVSSAGVLSVLNNFTSSNPTTGCAKFFGGVGIAQDVQLVSGGMNISGTTSLGATTPVSTTTAGVVTVNCTTPSSVYTTGCAIFYGGVGVASGMVGGGAFTVGATGLFGTSTALSFGTAGLLTVNNLIPVINATTGSAQFSGGIGIAGNFNAISGLLSVDGGGNLGTLGGSDLFVCSSDGSFIVKNSTASTLPANGCALFAGGVGVVKGVSVSGKFQADGISSMGLSSQVVVGGTGTLVVNNTFASADGGTGSAYFKGGFGVTGNLNVTGACKASGPVSIGIDTPLAITTAGIVTVNNTIDGTSSQTGCGIFHGGVGIAENMNIGGKLSVSGLAQFGNPVTTLGTTGLANNTNTTDSTDRDTGSAVFLGGIGVAKMISASGALHRFAAANFGSSTSCDFSTAGIMTVNNTIASANSTTGCAIFKGGIGVTGKINVGGTVAVTGTATFGSATPLVVSSAGAITVDNTIQSTNSNTGSGHFKGGVAIAKQLRAAGMLRVVGQGNVGQSNPVLFGTDGSMTVQNTTECTAIGTGSALFCGGLAISGLINVSGNLDLGGNNGTTRLGLSNTDHLLISTTGLLNVRDATASTNSTNGAVVIAGGLVVVQDISVSGAFNLSGAATLGSTDPVSISSAGIVTVPNSTNATTTTTGSMTVAGGMAVVKNMNLAGGMYVTGSSTGAFFFGVSPTWAVVSDAGDLIINNTSDSRAATQGALQIAGGLGVVKAIYCSGMVDANGQVDIGDNPVCTISTAGALAVKSTRAAGNVTGAGYFKGGIAMTGRMLSSGTCNISGTCQFGDISGDPAIQVSGTGILVCNSTFGSSSSVTGCAWFVGGVAVVKEVSVGGNITVAGLTTLGNSPTMTTKVSSTGMMVVLNTTSSSVYTNGCAVFAGGVGVAENVNASGLISVNGQANLGNSTICTVSSAGKLTVANTLASSASTTGCMALSGGLFASGMINVGGNITVTKDMSCGEGLITGILTTAKVGLPTGAFLNATGTTNNCTWADVDQNNIAFGLGIGSAVLNEGITCWFDSVIYNQWTPTTLSVSDGVDHAFNISADGAGAWGTDYYGSSIIPANTWKIGETYEFEISAVRDNTSGTVTFAVFVGANTFSTTTTIAPTNQGLLMMCRFTRTGTATVRVYMNFTGSYNASSSSKYYSYGRGNLSYTASSDTTLKVTCNGSIASGTVTVRHVTIRQIS